MWLNGRTMTTRWPNPMAACRAIGSTAAFDAAYGELGRTSADSLSGNSSGVTVP